MKNFLKKCHQALRRVCRKVASLWRGFTELDMERQRFLLTIVIGGLALILIAVAILVGVSNCEPKGQEAEQTMQEGPNESALPEGEGTPNPNGTIPDPLTGTDPTEGQQNLGTATNEPENGPTDEPQVTPEPLKKGDRGEKVLDLQEVLMDLGYLSLEEPTDYFGSGTEYALELFQRQHGLEQDGVAGTQTQAILFSRDAQPYVIKEGAEGRDVKMLQEQLCDLGYMDDDDVDRIYGPTTVAAVMAFQDRNGLDDDGKAGEKTLAKLFSDSARATREMEKALEEEEERRKEKEKEDEEENRKEEKISKFIKVAKSKIGCEYILGDRGPDTFDCSGFVYYCLRQAGVSVKRLNAAGYSDKSSWKEIDDIDDLEKGDIIFFRSDESSRVSHCGIYIGSGTMIDASSANGEVVKRGLSSYWKRNFVNGRRPWE